MIKSQLPIEYLIMIYTTSRVIWNNTLWVRKLPNAKLRMIKIASHINNSETAFTTLRKLAQIMKLFDCLIQILPIEVHYEENWPEFYKGLKVIKYRI